MKDRIREVMETQHMSQQVFAQFIEISTATLSSIFNGRTRPTLNIVEAIKKKLPQISIDWLLFGSGPMYVTEQSPTPPTSTSSSNYEQGTLDFDLPVQEPHSEANGTKESGPSPSSHNGSMPGGSSVHNKGTNSFGHHQPAGDPINPTTHPKTMTGISTQSYRVPTGDRQDGMVEDIHFYEPIQRKITEIRIYFDDLTYETFVPSSPKGK